LPTYRKYEDSIDPKRKMYDWNSKLKAKVVVDGTLNKRDDQDKSWTVEMALPLADANGLDKPGVKVPPAVGDVWRMNMYRWIRPRTSRRSPLAGARRSWATSTSSTASARSCSATRRAKFRPPKAEAAKDDKTAKGDKAGKGDKDEKGAKADKGEKAGKGDKGQGKGRQESHPGKEGRDQEGRSGQVVARLERERPPGSCRAAFFIGVSYDGKRDPETHHREHRVRKGRGSRILAPTFSLPRARLHSLHWRGSPSVHRQSRGGSVAAPIAAGEPTGLRPSSIPPREARASRRIRSPPAWPPKSTRAGSGMVTHPSCAMGASIAWRPISH
jgi:hypothetical protein